MHPATRNTLAEVLCILAVAFIVNVYLAHRDRQAAALAELCATQPTHEECQP